MNDATYITESLARGLTTRFFREMDEFATKAELQLLTKIPKIKDRNSYKKYIQEMKRSLGEAILVDYLGGSNSKPYFALDLIEIYKEREFNEWKEKCLTGSTLIFSYDPRVFDTLQARYTLSEHAIFRLFCRTKPNLIGKIVDYKYILTQLKHVPLWSNFWQLQYFYDEDTIPKINAFLPAPDGLFLGDFNKEKRLIDVRTFISDNQLSEKQYAAKSALLKIGEPYLSSPLSFAIAVAGRFDFPSAIQNNICYEIFNSNEFRNIKDNLFERVDDDNQRASIKNKFELKIKEFASFTNKSIIDQVKKDIRGALIEYKTGQYKYLAEHPKKLR